MTGPETKIGTLLVGRPPSAVEVNNAIAVSPGLLQDHNLADGGVLPRVARILVLNQRNRFDNNNRLI